MEPWSNTSAHPGRTLERGRTRVEATGPSGKSSSRLADHSGDLPRHPLGGYDHRMFRKSAFSIILLMLLGPLTAASAELGPRLRYLRHLIETGRIDPVPRQIAVSLVVSEGEALTATLPDGVMVRSDESGNVLRTASVIPVLVEPHALGSLAELNGVELVETGWFPRSGLPPLDISTPEVGSPQVWVERDASGVPLTGSGVVIADLDTGVDVFHPNFFRPDGGVFDWIDVDGSNDLTPGVDAIDLDGDGNDDADEIIEVFEPRYILTFPDANPAGYDIDRDWLYADLDGNQQRDFGPASGFDDSSPSFGEPLFFADDTNGNNRLDVGESVIGLGTSKIRVVRERDGTVRRRGTDLILSEGDDFFPHGTWVTGIMMGGIANLSHMAGQAPDAELIVADMLYPSIPPFEDDMASLALWARSEGARMIMYESGNWVWAWLDGSHPNEIVMSDLAREGFPQFTATGNLTGGGQHLTRMLTNASAENLVSTTQPGWGIRTVWPSFIWQGDPRRLVVADRGAGRADALSQPQRTNPDGR